MNWQSIDTAPKDQVILTDEGLVIWSNKKRALGWIACDIDGCAFRCVDEGVFEMGPKWWMFMPKLPS